ncbi:MAG: acyltransferase, partial [Gammaproteobacteria bacterium]|nr:acyltransferase [Gammaproteobacteria bacterium]
MQRREDIQGLRAVAVTSVVAAHAGVPGSQGGFVGVDVFFVISGYLITGLLLEELDARASIAWGRFIGRRLKRLVPALVLVLGVTLLAAGALLLPAEIVRVANSAPFAATWTSNLFFAFADADYFAILDGADLFLHTWSLGVEEQFYLVWPLALLAIGRSQRRLVSFGLLALAGFAACVWLTAAAPLQAFYQMPARIWEFSVGAALCAASCDGRALPVKLARLGCAAGLGLIAVSVAVLVPGTPYPGFAALLPVAGTALVIGTHAAAGTRDPARRVLASRPLQWVGDRSYSWYLWHWPALALLSICVPGANGWQIALVAFLSLIAADASYRFVEWPLWKGRFSTLRLRLVAYAAVLSLTLLATAGTLLIDRASVMDDSSSHPVLAALGDEPAIYRRGCDTVVGDDRPIPCIDGTEDSPRTVVLVGDSVAAQWYAAMPAYFGAPEWRLVVFTKSLCPMVDEEFAHPRARDDHGACSRWRARTLDAIEELQPDVVVAGSDAAYPFTAGQWRDGSRRVIERLAVSAGQVLLLTPVPRPGFIGPL